MRTIKGYINKKKEEQRPSLLEDVSGVAYLVRDLINLKENISDSVDSKIEEAEDILKVTRETVDEKIKELEDSIEEGKDKLENVALDVLEHVKSITKGEDGQDADEEEIVERVTQKVRIDIPKLETKIIATILAQFPRQPSLDEEKLFKKFLAKMPKSKAGLKFIQERIETDPMSVIEKIMQLPEDKFKVKIANVEGLDQTIAAFRNQLARGYLHGGGDTVTAGTNVTITTNSQGQKVISAVGGGGVTVGQPVTGGISNSVLYDGPTGLVAVSTNFKYFQATDIFRVRSAAYTSVLEVDAANANVAIGDVAGDGSGTVLRVNDTAQEITANGITYLFTGPNNSGGWFSIDDPNGTVSIGDATSTNNGTYVLVNDASEDVRVFCKDFDIQGNSAFFVFNTSAVTPSLYVQTEMYNFTTAVWSNVGLLSLNGTTGQVTIGDCESLGNTTNIDINDAISQISYSAATSHNFLGGKAGFFVTPTARVHIVAGATGAGQAPLKFTSGTNLTAPEAGAMEWDGTRGYLTQTSGPTRQTLAYLTDVTLPTAFPWTVVAGTTQTATINNGYITNNAGVVTVTLPTTAAVGSIIEVAGLGAGGWAIAQSAGQQIHFGNTNTTSGAGGSLASTNRYDAVKLLCTVANNEFNVLSSIGNITIV